LSLRTVINYTNKHYKIFDFIHFILIIIFGFLLGITYNVDKTQDACNQFVIDNYFTYDMQRCLLSQGQIFKVPYSNQTFNLSNKIIIGDKIT